MDVPRERLAGANICPDTGFGTDHLNSFNEVAMLVDMLEGMPEMADDILAWRPRRDQDHFHVKGFREEDLAAAAFEAADAMVLRACPERPTGDRPDPSPGQTRSESARAATRSRQRAKSANESRWNRQPASRSRPL